MNDFTDDIEEPLEEEEENPGEESANPADEDIDLGGLGVQTSDSFVKGTAYFVDWAKHIITISSAILILSATFIKDIVSPGQPFLRWLVGGCLVLAYIALLLSVWKALRFISYTAGLVLASDTVQRSGPQLQKLQDLLHQTQMLFLGGVAAFCALAIVALITWVAGGG